MLRKSRGQGQEVWVSREQRGGELSLMHRLPVDRLASREARSAMVDAARAAVYFCHPSVLQVRDVRAESDAIVFVQAWPEGTLLTEAMKQTGSIPWREALCWMRQFSQGLAAAHTSGLTLSQISPEDFLVIRKENGTTRHEMVCLSPPVPAGWWLDVDDPLFASPEQLAGKPCDLRASLYSAGAVLAFMLTGRRPDPKGTWEGLIAGTSLPQAVKNAVSTVLQTATDKRCPSPLEWIEKIDLALGPDAHQALAAIPVPAASQTKRVSPTDKTTLRWSLATAAGLIIGTMVWVAFAMESDRRALKVVSSNKPPVTQSIPTISVTGTKAAAKPDVTAVDSKAPEPVRVEDLHRDTPMPPREVPVVPSSLKPKPAVEPEELSREALLVQARAAHGPERTALYRKVLEVNPSNREALRALVEHSLADLPRDEKQRNEVLLWAEALREVDDPVGSHAFGCMAIQEADGMKNPAAAAKVLIQAASYLKRALREGHPQSYSVLLQAYVNLHNVQWQGGDRVQAERTRRSLFDTIDSMPEDVPTKDARVLAEKLHRLMQEGERKGKPHPQAAFLVTVMQRLHTVAAKRGDADSREWLRRHG